MVALGKKSIGGLSFRKKSSTPTQEVLKQKKTTTQKHQTDKTPRHSNTKFVLTGKRHEEVLKQKKTTTQHRQQTDKTPRHSNTKFVLTGKRHDYSDDESSVSHSSSSSSDDDDESRYNDDSVVVGRGGGVGGIRDMSMKDDDELNRWGTSWDDDEQQDNAFFEKSVKVETQQAVVKVVEHGNIEKLVLEVSALCVYLCMCILLSSGSHCALFLHVYFVHVCYHFRLVFQHSSPLTFMVSFSFFFS